ncbi:Tigger transposable element-derived protein 5 [Dissophora ornata]|nr:Tigger transposable element-derived protein 5 [Dissophora ornata]
MSVAAVAPQDSESSPSTEEEQRFWDKLYASPRRTPSVTKGWSFEEQEVLERPASSTCEPILDDQEYTDNDIEHQTLDQRQDEVKREGRISQKRTTNEMDAGDHYPIEGKRPRRSYQLQKKLQIIEYWTKNPQSYSKIAKHFHVPRMTVHGIIKNKAILQQLAESSPHLGLTLETSRVAKLHFAVLEELLLAWILDLKSRGIPVSGHKITTQAFEIHRMLSGLLLKPLPPCQFSSGWLKNFKNRRQISLRGMHSENTNDDDTARAFKELHAKLDGFNMRIRHGSGIPGIDGYGDVVVNAGVEDLTTSVFKDWLTRFDRERALLFKVALLVDEAVWRLLEVDPCESTYTTGGVTVFKVPKELSALMPMSSGIAKELKADLHFLLEARKAALGRPTGAALPTSATQLSDIPIEDYWKFILEAWNCVKDGTLHHSFKRFLPSNTFLPCNDEYQQDVDPVLKLEEVVEYVTPAFPACIVEYYLHRDRDIGPTSFLRAKIQEMQRQPDYEKYFGTLSFGEVRVASTIPSDKPRVQRIEVS